MQYIGIQHQVNRNNRNSFLLLAAFPVLLLAMTYSVLFFAGRRDVSLANKEFFTTAPFVLVAVAFWFAIAWSFNGAFISMATRSQPLDRAGNPRVYNLVENLCIQQGMRTPAVYLIDDDSLNAFASGVNEKTYAVTLSRGIIEKLDDEELEGVIAHELTHIRNHDTRLLIISVIFVGIFAFLAQLALRSLYYGGRKKGTGYILLIAILVTAVCYLLSLFLRFGISRSREYLADAGSAEWTKKPYALANALRKIDKDPLIEAVHSKDVAQLFIDNPQRHRKTFLDNLFNTHPPIEKRIELLDHFV